MKILDIGARGGAMTIFPHFLDNRRFEYFLRKNIFEIIGVEPDKAEREKLINSGFYKAVFSIAIYDRDGTANLNITQSNDCSSILEPNPIVITEIIDKEWWPKFEVVETISIETKRLETFCRELNLNFDLIKVDVQGVEYEIINSGLEVVQNAIGILAELNSVPWYLNQKSLKEFSSFTYKYGFIEIARNHKPHIPTESDLLFIKKFNQLKNRDELIKVLLLIFIFNRDKLFVIYTIKGFLRGFLSFKDMRNIYYVKRRNFFLDE